MRKRVKTHLDDLQIGHTVCGSRDRMNQCSPNEGHTKKWKMQMQTRSRQCGGLVAVCQNLVYLSSIEMTLSAGHMAIQNTDNIFWSLLQLGVAMTLRTGQFPYGSFWAPSSKDGWGTPSFILSSILLPGMEMPLPSAMK